MPSGVPAKEILFLFSTRTTFSLETLIKGENLEHKRLNFQGDKQLQVTLYNLLTVSPNIS